MRIIFGITLLCFLFFLPSQAQWEDFRNLKFTENAPDSISGKAYWRMPDFVNATSAFQNHKKKKNPCLKISGAFSNDRPGYVFQQYPVSVQEYTQLKISARIKGSDIANGKGYIYSYTRNGDLWLQYQTLEQGAVEGTTDWQDVSLKIWVGPDAGILRIGAALEGEGSSVDRRFSDRGTTRPKL